MLRKPLSRHIGAENVGAAIDLQHAQMSDDLFGRDQPAKPHPAPIVLEKVAV